MSLRAVLVLAVMAGVARMAAGATALVLEKQNVVVAAKPNSSWMPAIVGQELAVRDRLRTGENSRALVKLTDLSMLRLNEFTSITILEPGGGRASPGLDLLGGAAYFLSRERPEEIRIRTPSANGISRGTEFLLAVRGSKTTLAMFEGEVEIGNAVGRVTARTGELVEIEPGIFPRKTALIEAKNIIQWCLYYPGVVQLDDLALSAAERKSLASSLGAYAAGDLPGALRSFSGRPEAASPAVRTYAAAMYLTAGQVSRAEEALAGLGPETPGAEALRMLIAAVNFEERDGHPATASDWIAQSYYEQSRSRLEEAREAARRACAHAPTSGYAWTRLGELEFSFGRVPQARSALEKARALTPRNAHSATLAGFIASAENRIAAARSLFEEAVSLDNSLGTAWLGRALVRIRKGDAAGGRRDLQAAAALEPNRSLFRSYLGKAWSDAGQDAHADRELSRAAELDPNDPTPWLYRALQDRQENRLNEAVRDLEQSLALNENRRLFRSRFLLDQDKAVRGSNLASIYQLNGMPEVAVREAGRAVAADYASAGAHRFLADSYNALRDPRRINLRYETPFTNELLLANLLSPVGAGSLSQNVSEQEYSRLFESDGMGGVAAGEYLSSGQWRTVGSLYGTYGNFSFALDGDYFYDDDPRPRRALTRLGETSVKLKFQLTPADIVLFEAGVLQLREGDARQLYDERALVPSLRIDERQEPGDAFIGLRHEWAPGIQTLALAGRLASEFRLGNDAATTPVFSFAPANSLAEPVELRPGYGIIDAQNLAFRERYRLGLEIGSGELQQIFTLGPHTLVAGGRYQNGSFDVHSELAAPAGLPGGRFASPAARDVFSADFERWNVYLCETFRVSRTLTLIGGCTFDRLLYPGHFRVPPVRNESGVLEHWSPKAGVIFEPAQWVRLRGAYAEAISGVSLDESTRLEPTQIAGFNQGFRSLLNESVAGSVSAARYKILAAAAEAKTPFGTYFGLEWTLLKQEADSPLGQFDDFRGQAPPSARAGPGLLQRLDYEERAITATLNQLLGQRWSLGASYRVTWSEFQGELPELFAFPGATSHRDSELHQLLLAANWNHECGFFLRADALWTRQENDGFISLRRAVVGEPGDDFWQLNAFAGYRFPRNRGEISVGVLNLLDTDYQLEPLTPYAELPHERSLIVRCRVSF